MKNICIVRLSAVGDVCHVTAIARSIQDHYPNTKITWIIGKVESRLISKTNDIEFSAKFANAAAAIAVSKAGTASVTFDEINNYIEISK